MHPASSGTSPIYLDHNATTPVHAAVLEAMLPFLKEHFGNPSSGHVFGTAAKRAVERAREQVASLLVCRPDEIVFTSGGTESNNLAIRGAVDLSSGRRHVVTSSVEHPAVARPCEHLEKRGIEVTRLPVDGSGRLASEAARAFVRGDTALVTVILAQNETGTLMPIADLACIAREHGALFHSDAAQAVGKIRTEVDRLGVDMLSIAGHKLYAPKGVGALFVRRGVRLAPVLLGAGQERGVRPGTENVASIVGLGTACELCAADMHTEAERQRTLRDRLFETLRVAIPGIRFFGHLTERLPNTLNISFPDVRGAAVLAAAPEVAASTGSACHEGAETPSAVLMSMGIDDASALGAVRLSLGRSTTPGEIDRAGYALVKAWRSVRGIH